jgi:mono/diheme cytochrome c family protein
MFRWALSWAIWILPTALLSQETDTKIDLSSGKAIFLAACAGCHGSDGKGAPDTTVGFEKPETFPDFTRCDQTTPELDVDWKAIIREGGRGRGFSRIMPSFAEALTSRQIDMVIGYLRGFCSDPKYPRGELNLPRAQVTEKAFPEDEVVLTTTTAAQGSPQWNSTIQYEHRLSRRNQMEIALPFTFSHGTSSWVGGVGDIGIGLKHILGASYHTGSILSVQGEVILPSGNHVKGLGSGVTTFEGFATFGQLLPFGSFVQAQAGTEEPVHTSIAPRSIYWRTALGKSMRQDGVGRLWSPIVEFLADRDLLKGSHTNWDIFPQFQVTLNRRQHVRLNFGTRVPVTNTGGRAVQISMYVLWDWFDGGLMEGWR